MSSKTLIQALERVLTADNVKENEPLALHSSFRVGGPADLFVRVRTGEELATVLELLAAAQMPCFVLGKGTNLLASDEGYRGAIITMTGAGAKPVTDTAEDHGETSETPLDHVVVEGNVIKAGAGASLTSVALAARDHGLTGLEFAAGIPGSVGGGLVMNAGAYGGEMKQVVSEVKLFMPGGELWNVSCEGMKFGYRDSILKHMPAIALEGTFTLAEGDPEEIGKTMKELAARRREKQPLEFPSAGSTFKRPEGMFAGKLIMDSGLAGYMVGGACVSEKHCGFVVNKGGATAADVKAVIAHVQEKVFADTGVKLEREVIYL